MRITQYTTDDAVLQELGARLAGTRLEQNLSQDELADKAGVARITVARLEAGETVKTPSLIRVIRALGLLDGLGRAIPEPGPSPIERLKLEGRRRRRATGARGARTARQHKTRAPWGDEIKGDGQA